MTIFIGGSRNFKSLNKSIILRLLNIIKENYRIVVGDADGADKSIQEFLLEHNYKNVEVYCSGNICRNNLNNWPTHKIEIPTNVKGRKFYMVKDLAMAKICNYGFMLWDGKSPGTMNNILNLLDDNKKVLIYFSPNNNFFTVLDINTLNELLDLCKTQNIEAMDSKIQLYKRIKDIKEPAPEQLQLTL